MTNSAHFLLTQVSPGRFTIRETSKALMPGPAAPERWVICVERIPKKVTAEMICKRLSYVVYPLDPPAFIGWNELITERKRIRDRTNKRLAGNLGRRSAELVGGFAREPSAD